MIRSNHCGECHSLNGAGLHIVCLCAHEQFFNAQAEQMRLVASSSGIIAVHGQASPPAPVRERVRA